MLKEEDLLGSVYSPQWHLCHYSNSETMATTTTTTTAAATPRRISHTHTSLRHHCSTSSSPTSILHLRPLIVAFILVLLVDSSFAQSSCTNTAGCFPSMGNLATGRTVTTNSTCTEGELLCPLFLVMPCTVCSANSSQNLNDGNNNTFWASEIGPQVREVALRLDFENPVNFQDMTLVWMSVRPVAMTLERSCDFGETWSVYRYYAVSCSFYFNMEDTFIHSATPTFSSTAPICTSVQSELFRFDFSDATVTFSTSEHMPANSEESSCYQDITNLRVVFLDLFPEVRISNSSFQYYGVREWIVRGTCACNGHAGSCTPADGEQTAAGKVYTGCACEHNTEGTSCDSCTEGFNNIPYQPGTPTEANACEGCFCNGHAQDCVFNDTEMTSACINCTDNTVGPQCEGCASGYFQDMGLLLDDPNICTACSCDSAGITDNGDCDNNGQCSCKRNVGGMTCSECQQGYFNFSSSNPDGCQECRCSSTGTELGGSGLPLCDVTMGECQCLPTTEGERCDRCRPGSYDFSSGCLPCACNIGGSTSAVCDRDSGQCSCKPNIEGRDCSTPATGFYAQPLDQVTLEAEDYADSIVIPEGEELGTFMGRGYGLVDTSDNITFTWSLSRNSQYQLIVRISPVLSAPVNVTVVIAMADASVQEMMSSITISPDSNQTAFILDSTQLAASTNYELTLSANGQLLVDSLVVLPDIAVTSAVYSQASSSVQSVINGCLPLTSRATNTSECEAVLFTLSTEFYGETPLAACGCHSDGSVSVNCTSAGCTCKTGVTGFTCDLCAFSYFNLSSTGCEECLCNSVGATSVGCSGDGICTCKLGVDEPTCDNCRPGYFNFTSEGCSPCSCSQYSTSSMSCDLTSGQCTCLTGVTGRQCDVCLPGYYGLSLDGCAPCNCDPFGSVSGDCNTTTGQCACINGLDGRTCEICSSGFYFTAEVGGADTCERCVCSGRATTCGRSSVDGQLRAVQYNFTELCSDDSVNCGRGWTIRTDAGVEPSDPTALTVGFGYLLTGNDNPLMYVPDEYLGDRRHSYGHNFSVILVIQSDAAMKNQNLIVRLGSSLSARRLTANSHYIITSNTRQERVVSFTVLLEEQSFYYSDNSQETPNLLQFLDFLAGLNEIAFTADYTEDFIELNYVTLVTLTFSSSQDPPVNTSTNTVLLSANYTLENCSCDDPYQGLSCENCARGYYRPSGRVSDECLRCECNGQTPDCDPRTGVCLNCGGNTAGNNCERCLDGYYGDPTRGVACLPCDCPQAGRGFSSTCSLNETDGLSVCDNCSRGYTGRNCEKCMDGYFGDPNIGHCVTCECNGNVDPALGPVCDMTTGQCLNCLNNTGGFECHICTQGYHGDPGNNIPCQICDCDPRGTDSYCDTLYGTCYCLPNVVSGVRCDECVDGFFNITAGVGCTLCDCDSVGAIGDICDKVTGDCSCLPNVGSPEDNKCISCTPGYFNFTNGVGCQECGCSALSVSASCDPLSGACQCQEGAIGDKCDDCAFGFLGKVPDCEPCHECYFQWYNLTNDFTGRVTAPNSSIFMLMSYLYGDRTVANISMEISVAIEELGVANQTLNSITFNQTSVDELRTLLYQTNMSLSVFNVRIDRISTDLNETEGLLNMSNAFDGTLNMTDVVALGQRLGQLNSTAFYLGREANVSITQLRADQMLAQESCNTLSALNERAQVLLAAQGEAVMNATSSLQFAMRLNQTFMSLRRNLTRLDMTANMIEQRIAGLVQRTGNVSLRLNDLNSSLAEAYGELYGRESELEELSNLVRIYNSTVGSLEMASNRALGAVEELQMNAERGLNVSNALLQFIANARNVLLNISRNFEAALNVSANINSIILPTEEYIVSLARRITDNIVPEDVVEEIMRNASRSRAIAEDALDLAQNTSRAVMNAIAMAANLQEAINTTSATQQLVNQTLAEIRYRTAPVLSDIARINDASSELAEISVSARMIYDKSLSVIENTQDLVGNIRTRTGNYSSAVTAGTSATSDYYNEFLRARESLNSFQNQSQVIAAAANATLTEAQQILQEALSLEAIVTRVTPQDINSLAQELEEELRRNNLLQQQVSALTQEMSSLTQTFTDVSQKLKRCYRTP